MSSRRRRKPSRTRRIDDNDAQQRQAAEAATSFWHGRASPASAMGDGTDGTSSAVASGKAASSEASQAQERVEADPTSALVFEKPRRITVTADPTSTVRSLGKPPLSGREAVAEHYFEAVYKRAVAMAGALAAAGDLLADDKESA